VTYFAEGLPNSADVVVIGSGAGGATVAGELARKGHSVVVVEAGPAGTGAHGRNLDSTPRGTRGFADYLADVLAPLNRATASPERLPGLVGRHGLGGMFTAWTHNAPTPDRWELPNWIDHERWANLVARASDLIHVGTDISTEDQRYKQFEEIVALRVGVAPAGREVQPAPIAAERKADGGWRFSGADDLFHGVEDKIYIATDHVARSVLSRGGVVDGVLAFPAAGGNSVRINAGAVVIAAGTLGSAQLIAASDLDAGPALGGYLTEHTIVATRVFLKENLKRHSESNLFPPSVWIPASQAHEWSTTINATQWNFNPAIPAEASFDNTIDLISFCPVEPHESNRLTFDNGRIDQFGLPTATGQLELSNRDFEVAGDALRELFLLSSDLGDLVDGWGMRVPQRAGSHHLSGSCRMDVAESDASVVSPEGRMWRYENCYVTGNAVLGERSASNPSLTTIAYALNTADAISNPSASSLVAAQKEFA
jgi:hypothetical protein